MLYLISFLEGIVTFVSPCILPMLPVYLAYFAGDVESQGQSKRRTIVNALAFVLGFSVVFVALGAFSGTVGLFLKEHQALFNIACGAVVIVLGLNYMGVLNIELLNKATKANVSVRPNGFLSSALFGIVFAAGWTPCVGVFLGSALALAAQQGSAATGMAMLACYSVGLGIPFALCAVLVKQLEGAFGTIKRHYRVINVVCGSLLVFAGVLMATGLFGVFLSSLSV